MPQQKSSGQLSSGERSSSGPHSLIHLASCAVTSFKQSANRLCEQLWRESSMPFKLLAATWLLSNVVLPVLFISHPLARSTLLHASAALAGSVVCYRLLGDGPFLFAPFLLLLPLLVPQLPPAFIEVDGRTLVLLPWLLFPRLFPVWRQLQLVIDTLTVAAVAQQLKRYVTVDNRQVEGNSEMRLSVGMPVLEREVATGEWQLALTATIRTKAAAEAADKRQDEMDTAAEAEEGAQSRQQPQQEWSAEEVREREEAEYPRAPPSSPADFPLKRKVPATLAEGERQTHPESEDTAAQVEGRGKFQSPRPQGAVAGLDVKRLRRVLDPAAAEHECFKASADTTAAPHGDPLIKAEQQQQQQQQHAVKQEQAKPKSAQ